MTTLQEAARKALEYIEQTAKFVPHTHDQAGCDAATALRAALAQPNIQNQIVKDILEKP